MSGGGPGDAPKVHAWFAAPVHGHMIAFAPVATTQGTSGVGEMHVASRQRPSMTLICVESSRIGWDHSLAEKRGRQQTDRQAM